MRFRLITMLVTIMFLCIVDANPIASSVGARHVLSSCKEETFYTAADYVQDGLIALWDGIENIGYGLHDDAPEYWVDITGGGADWLLRDHHADTPFGIGVDYVQILTGVSYNGRGHCSPSWASPDEIKILEMVLDESEYDSSQSSTMQLLALGVSNGNFMQRIQLQGLTVASLYGQLTSFNLTGGHDAFSLEFGSSVILNGTAIPLSKSFFAQYTYYPPVLGGYAIGVPVGIKIKCMRLYGRSLTDKERLYNYAVDKARFGL